MNKLMNIFKSLFKLDSYNNLGRWCHKGMPNCCDRVIEKKIKFALMDNNLCDKPYEIITKNEKKRN